MVFLIDLPRLEAGNERSMTAFGENVIRFLEASGVDDGMVKSLTNYDFDATKRLGFVYSMSVAILRLIYRPVMLTQSRPGGHTGESLRRIGEWWCLSTHQPSSMACMLTAIFFFANN